MHLFDGNSPYAVVQFVGYTEYVATKHEENKKKKQYKKE
jgi:hypothetical protein